MDTTSLYIAMFALTQWHFPHSSAKAHGKHTTIKTIGCLYATPITADAHNRCQ